MMSEIQSVLAAEPALAFAVLIGSRATDTARPLSDWDIAIAWKHGGDAYQHLARQEKLRHRLARVLTLPDGQVDLVDLATARLAMKAVVAEEGRLLHLGDELAWMHFLQRTWRELEDHYWYVAHAA